MGTAMKLRLLATAILVLSVSAPSFAADMYVRHHHHHASGDDNIYLHNYGPPDFYPGTNVPARSCRLPRDGPALWHL